MPLFLLLIFTVGLHAQVTVNPPQLVVSSTAADVLRAWMTTQTTGPTLVLAAPISAGDTTLTADGAAVVDVADVIAVGTEHMTVVAKTANTITVTRAANGTTARPADQGAAVRVLRFRTLNLAARALLVGRIRDMVTEAEYAAIRQRIAAAQTQEEADLANKVAAAVQ